MIRMPMFLGVFLNFFVGGVTIKLLVKDPRSFQSYIARWIQLHAKIIRLILNIRITVGGGNGDSSLDFRAKHDVVLFVSNHLSYLDAVVLASLWPMLFVTSVEVKETLFLGHLARASGSLFVERRNRSRVSEEVGAIASAMLNGCSVMVFPEATSSNGEDVLPFKKSMFASAVLAGVPVRPLSLAYTHINGATSNRHNRDLVCWYGRMEFLGHFLGLLGLTGLKSKIQVGEDLEPNMFPEHSKLAEASWIRIRTMYRTMLSGAELSPDVRTKHDQSKDRLGNPFADAASLRELESNQFSSFV